MRIFLSILILSPLLSYNQEKLDLRDLKSISSKSTFQKVVLENKFSLAYYPEFPDQYNDKGPVYGYNLDNDYQNPIDYTASTWAFFYNYTETFRFNFYKLNTESEMSYKRIVRQIQSSCNFHSIDENSDYDIIYYGCPGAKFKGVIGYYDDGDDALIIQTKLPTRN